MMPACIAIDLGGSQLRVAKVLQDGRIEWRRSVVTVNQGNPAQVIDQIADLVATTNLADICGMAIAAPGPMDTRNGVVLRIPTLLGWEDVCLRDMLAKRFKLPVLAENDAIAAAVGQWRFGAAKGFDEVVYLTVSTGIGGGIISDGKVVRGARGFAGHFGHLLLDPESSRRCSCGRFGCFEAYASGSALDGMAKSLATSGSRACQQLWANVVSDEPPAARHIALAAAIGHGPSLQVWHQQGQYLAQGICSIVHALNPEVVIMGGGVCDSYALFCDSLQEHLAVRLMPEFDQVIVKLASNLQDAGLLGVAALLFDDDNVARA